MEFQIHDEKQFKNEDKIEFNLRFYPPVEFEKNWSLKHPQQPIQRSILAFSALNNVHSKEYNGKFDTDRRILHLCIVAYS